MVKKKMGMAFSDYVSTENIKVRKFGSRGRHRDVLSIFPLITLIFLSAMLFIRLFYIQILRGDYYKELSNSNRTRVKIISAERGIIFDRNKKPLVRNSPAFKIIDKNKPDGKQVIFLEKDEALKLITENKNVINDIRRDYLYKSAFAHVLGYTGQVTKEEITSPEYAGYSPTDFSGKMGVELEYEGLLHGRNGKELFEVDAHGKTIRFLGRQEPEAGQDITTTLDVDVQVVVEVAMKEVEKGAVVVSDPRNGSIISLFSKPTFDPNLFTASFISDKNIQNIYKSSGDYQTLAEVLSDSNNQPFLNRAIGGIYPPGSTFKLVSAVAALQHGEIKPDTQIEDTGILQVGTFSFGNWYFLQHGGKDGMVDVIKGIKRSNDIYFYKAAESVGPRGIAKWAKLFGAGGKLGIDIPGEVKGLVPDPDWKKKIIGEQWYLGDTFHYGIGQGFLLTTPLQVNFWTIPFANDGTLYKPHIVGGQKEVIRQNFFKKEYRDLVRQGMKESCEAGGVAWPFFDFKVKNSLLKIDNIDYFEDSSSGAKMTRVKVGCKTGTAETTIDQKPHAWITVFAPFANPEIVTTVLVEHGGEGSSVAGSIAEKILRAYFEKKK